MAIFSILCIMFSFWILLIISSILSKNFSKKYSEIIWIIYLSLLMTALSINWYIKYQDYFFWKENIQEVSRIQEMYKKQEITSDIINTETKGEIDIPEPRSLHKVEIFRYIKVAIYEEIIKIIITIFLFVIYVVSNKKNINKTLYPDIILFTLFLSSFSFYIIENIMYASNNIPLMAQFFRTISPAHFFIFIIVLNIVNFSKITKTKMLVILLISIVLHFIFDALLTMNYSGFWVLTIWIWLFFWFMWLMSYAENNRNIWQY